MAMIVSSPAPLSASFVINVCRVSCNRMAIPVLFLSVFILLTVVGLGLYFLLPRLVAFLRGVLPDFSLTTWLLLTYGVCGFFVFVFRLADDLGFSLLPGPLRHVLWVFLLPYIPIVWVLESDALSRPWQGELKASGYSSHSDHPHVVSIGLTDEIRSQQRAAQSPLDPATEAIVDRIVQLVGGDAGFSNEAPLREIGEALDRQGGVDRMRLVYYCVRNKGLYFSHDIWHMIEDWRE